MPNSWVCVDANVVIRLVADPKDEAVLQLWEQWEAEEKQLVAPTLLYYEVVNALYHYAKLRTMSSLAVRLALKAALRLPIQLRGEMRLHQRALELAEQFSLPATYDAHYLAVAEQLEAEFWTTDARLAQAVRHALPWVRLAIAHARS